MHAWGNIRSHDSQMGAPHWFTWFTCTPDDLYEEACIILGKHVLRKNYGEFCDL